MHLSYKIVGLQRYLQGGKFANPNFFEVWYVKL